MAIDIVMIRKGLYRFGRVGVGARREGSVHFTGSGLWGFLQSSYCATTRNVAVLAAARVGRVNCLEQREEEDANANGGSKQEEDLARKRVNSRRTKVASKKNDLRFWMLCSLKNFGHEVINNVTFNRI